MATCDNVNLSTRYVYLLIATKSINYSSSAINRCYSVLVDVIRQFQLMIIIFCNFVEVSLNFFIGVVDEARSDFQMEFIEMIF